MRVVKDQAATIADLRRELAAAREQVTTWKAVAKSKTAYAIRLEQGFATGKPHEPPDASNPHRSSPGLDGGTLRH